jgi:cell division protease FtsH
MIATRQRLRDIAATSQFVANKNRRRALFALGFIAVIFLVYGARNVISGLLTFLTQAPMLAIQLGFALMFGILQFAGIMWFLSRPRRYTIKPDDAQIGMSFENYRGQPDLLEHARSTVSILQGVKEFELRGGEMPKGMLLSGSPGTGKTFLAAIIASEANLPFIYIDASSLRGMFWGMTELMIVKLFRDARGLARKYAKSGQRGACIVFMDEIDSIGMNRGGQGGMGMFGGMMMGGGTGLNTLLNQMDSLTDLMEDRWRFRILRWFGLVRGKVKNKPLVFVIGATNRPNVLDPALTRPGRLDRILEVHVPDGDGRRDIIEHYLADKAHDPDISVELMVADSIGWTPIQIKTIINEALIKAHDDGRERLNYKDWIAASDERNLGLKQPIRKMNPDDIRAVSYHEAGHAIAAYYLLPEIRIQKATIQRQGHALGFVMPLAREERYTEHARQIEEEIMVSLASRAVEEEILHTKMSGASSDLQNATTLAMRYCSFFGMGSTLIVMPPDGPLKFPMPVTRMADQLLDILMVETKRLIHEKEYAVHAVAAALIEHKELIGRELEEVFEAADAANPGQAGPFERKLITLSPLFKKSVIVEDDYSETGEKVEPEDVAAASGAAYRMTDLRAPLDEPSMSTTFPGQATSYTD